jgi:hypothetical protein
LEASGSMKLTKYLIFIDAVIWILLGLVIAAGFHPALPEGRGYRWVMTALSLLAGFFFVMNYWIMTKRGGLAYYLMLGALAFVIILTLADQFGVADLIVFLINLITFALLLKDKADYLRVTSETPS